MTTIRAADEKNALIRVLPELVRLSPAARIEVIHQLVDSMRPAPAADSTESSETPVRQNLLDFAGAWDNDGEAEKMEQAILGSRHSEIKTSLENWE